MHLMITTLSQEITLSQETSKSRDIIPTTALKLRSFLSITKAEGGGRNVGDDYITCN